MRLAERGASLLALVLAAALIGHALGAPPDPAAKQEEESKITFSPDVEKKMTEFFDKMKESKRSVWEVRMRKEIEDLEKASPLGAEGRKALDAAAQKTIQVCLDDWTAMMAAAFREQYVGEGDQLLNLYEQLLTQADEYVKNDSWYAGEAVQPVEHPGWIEALRQTLPAEQMAAVENARAERNRLVGKEIAEFLKANAEMARQQQGNTFTMWGDEIKGWLVLSKERADQLDALAKAMTDEVAENGRKRAEKWLLSADDEQRRQTIKQGRMYYRNTAKEVKAQRAKWDEGMAKILSAEDMQRVQSLQGDLKARRGLELGKAMLSVLDEKLGLTAEQRERLRPIAERLVLNSPSFFPPNEVQSYYWSASPQLFFNAASKAKAEELKPILDEKQIERWKETCAQKNSNNVRQVAAVNGSGAKQKEDWPENPEPEEIERALSDVLHEKTVAERQRVLAMNLLKVEDVNRVAKLSPEVVRRLETAARGVTEEALISWKTLVEQNSRSQGQQTTPAALNAFFVNVRNGNFQVSSQGATDKSAVWEKTVKAELSDAQRAAWQKELDERSAFREKAIIGTVMAGFARRNTLTMEQWDKLEPLVTGVIKEYSQDIGGMFSSSNSNRWYFQYYTMLTPFMGIPEEQLKEILGKERWQHWTESQEFGNTMQYWKNIQSNHARRVEKKKE